MRIFDLPEPVEALSRLLDRERSAILKGDFVVLAGLVVEKNRLLATVARRSPSADHLTSLRQKSGRNHVLLAAAIEGIRSVLRDIAEPRPFIALETYDQSGDRCAFRDSCSFEKRY